MTLRGDYVAERRKLLLAAAGMLLLTFLLAWPAAANAAVIMPTGWNGSTFPANDDSSMTITLPFSINIAGGSYNSGSLSNNGYLTIGGETLRLFNSDIDTRLGNPVTYGSASWNGRPVFCINFYGVRRYPASSNTALNYMQMVIVDRSDIEAGAWDLWYNYDSIEWDPAWQVGFSGAAGAYSLPGSGVSGAYIDGGSYALATNSLNSGSVGSYLFEARSGMLVADPNVAPTVLTSPVTLEGNTSGGYTGAIPGASASDSDGTVVSFVNNAANPLLLGLHTITWTATDNDDATGTGTQSVTVRDTTGPTTPGLSGSSHWTGAWSRDNTVDVTLLASTDVCAGVDGYSYAFTGTVVNPDTVKDVEESQLSVTGPVLADGIYYFCVRAVDNAGNWSGRASFGPIRIDTTNPSAISFADSSHTVDVDDNDPTVDVAWNAATDATSGIDGYSYGWSYGSAVTPDTSKDAEESTLSLTSPILLDGSWYFNVRAVDNAGNWGAVTSYGPFVIDATPPSGEMVLDGDAAYTNSLSVDIDSSVTGASTMRVTSSGVVGGVVTYAASGSAVLGWGDGMKSVTVRYYDLAGNYIDVTDTIVLDQTAPITTADAEKSYLGGAVITLDASDVLSGVAETYYRLDTGAKTSGDEVQVTTSGQHSLAYWSVDNAGNVEDVHHAWFTVESEAVGIAGPTRYETALALSRSAFEDGSAEAAVICAGDRWPDAISTSSLAGALDGPLLLTSPLALPTGLADELDRLGVSEITVVGSTSAVSPAVIAQLEDVVGAGNVTRIGGKDRYETSSMVASATVAALAEAGRPFDGTAFVATGVNFPDAMSAAPISASRGWPIVLTTPSTLSSVASDTISGIGADRVVVLGSTGAVSAAVDFQLESIVGEGNVMRIAGDTRYDTALAVAAFGVENGLEYDGLAVCSGVGFADALSGGVVQGRRGSVVLLTSPKSLPSAVSALLHAERRNILTYYVLGGEKAISLEVRAAVASALK